MASETPATDPGHIESTLEETRRFEPPEAFAADARVDAAEFDRLNALAADDPTGFWGTQALEHLTWSKPFDRVSEGEMPETKWFLGGRLNASAQCLDRHLTTWRKNKAAIIWEGEPGDTRVLTYLDLHREVCKFASVLDQLGVVPGDRVTIYLPMIPEAAIAMLACARVGATHSVIFGGFSAEAVADRNNDAASKVVITADGGWRRGQEVPLKRAVDDALEKSPTVEHVVVVRRTDSHVKMVPDRDYWWHDLMESAEADRPATDVDAEHPLFILYTSGSTGKPKGVVHSTAGYMLGAAMTSKWTFDLKDTDTYWCTADVGWITGHSYIVYGPLANGATTLMYEGAPDWPDRGRLWEIVEKYRVNIFYTAPTAVRAFIKWGDDWPAKYDLSSLRLLGSVGEPINPEAWMWYREHIGGGRCPITDTYWQTETGGHVIAPMPGAVGTKPGSCMRPLPGIAATIVDEQGNEVPPGGGGLLVIKRPWPHMLRTVHGDHERFLKTYFGKIEGCYFAGDGARRDADGDFWVMGRVDDVMNVSGHRLSTMEIESALVAHETVAEAAVVGFPHEIKGEGICCFVTLKTELPPPDLETDLKDHVRGVIGAIATPDKVRFAVGLPKTRSGKIMRRLLRDIAAGRESTGDTTTLEDYTVLAKLRDSENS